MRFPITVVKLTTRRNSTGGYTVNPVLNMRFDLSFFVTRNLCLYRYTAQILCTELWNICMASGAKFNFQCQKRLKIHFTKTVFKKARHYTRHHQHLSNWQHFVQLPQAGSPPHELRKHLHQIPSATFSKRTHVSISKNLTCFHQLAH